MYAHGHKRIGGDGYEYHDHTDVMSTTYQPNGRHTHAGLGPEVAEERMPNGEACTVCKAALRGNPNDRQCERCGEVFCSKHLRRLGGRYATEKFCYSCEPRTTRLASRRRGSAW